MTALADGTALYRIRGEAGLLLYIGVSDNFGRRWREHAKKQPWWSEMRSLSVDRWYADRAEAETAEVDAIRAEKPKYNQRHTGPAPLVKVARRKAAGRGVSCTLDPQNDPGLRYLRAQFGTPTTDTPLLHDVEEAASLIGCTPNWLMTQARACLIVHTRLGRSVCWTPNQVHEILRAGEQKPRAGLVARAPARKRPAAAQKLQAKTPQRKRSAA